MPKSKKIKVIIDTNLFISFLIGRKLHGLKELLIDFRIELIFAEQNIQELRMVSQRPKFKKYFKSDDLDDLIDLIKAIGRVIEIVDVPDVCRDPKDNYLLELARISKSDYLVTGDIDLLEIGSYKGTKIITAKEFDRIVE
jgi:hypothetical protein